MVGRVLVVFGVVEDVVTIDGPSTVNPLMKFLVEHWFRGQVVVEVGLGRVLDRGLLSLRLAVLVDVVGVSLETTEGTSLVSKHTRASSL